MLSFALANSKDVSKAHRKNMFQLLSLFNDATRFIYSSVQTQTHTFLTGGTFIKVLKSVLLLIYAYNVVAVVTVKAFPFRSFPSFMSNNNRNVERLRSIYLV